MTTVTDNQKDRKPFSLGYYSVGKSSRLQRLGTIYFCSAIPPPGDLAVSHGLRQLLTTSVPWKARRGKEGVGRVVAKTALPFKDMLLSHWPELDCMTQGGWETETGFWDLMSPSGSTGCGRREGECGQVAALPVGPQSS